MAFTISKAGSTTTVVDAGGTYNGSAFAETSSAVTGAGGLSTTATSFDYLNTDTGADLGAAAPINAGDYSVTATYAGDANHNSSSSSAVAFTISKAGSTTTVVDAGGTYNGSAFPETSSSVTGAGGLSTDRHEFRLPQHGHGRGPGRHRPDQCRRLLGHGDLRGRRQPQQQFQQRGGLHHLQGRFHDDGQSMPAGPTPVRPSRKPPPR